MSGIFGILALGSLILGAVFVVAYAGAAIVAIISMIGRLIRRMFGR